jgi:hypothetical protein
VVQQVQHCWVGRSRDNSIAEPLLNRPSNDFHVMHFYWGNLEKKHFYYSHLGMLYLRPADSTVHIVYNPFCDRQSVSRINLLPR